MRCIGVSSHSSPSLLSRLLLTWRRLGKQVIRVCRRKDVSAGSKPGIDDLPSVLMSDILSRLPIQDIIKCKFVCKSWDEFITKDPDLVQLHWNRSTKRRPLSLLVQDVNFQSETSVVLLVSRRWKRMKILMTAREIPGRIVASCNGMLCVQILSKNLIEICNPFTRDRLALPELDFKLVSYTLGYGFGFDSTSNKYKVILTFHGSGLDGTKSRIITLGEDRWREIDFPSEMKPDTNPLFFNGSFHWIPSPPLKNGMITALDISDEKFNTVLLPSFPAYIIKEDYGPCSFHYEDYSSYFSFGVRTWKLMEATTDTSIDDQSSDRDDQSITFTDVNIMETKLRLLGVIGNGDYLLMASDAGERAENGSDNLIFYDSKKTVVSYMGIVGVRNFFEAMMFVPSLICPSTL